MAGRRYWLARCNAYCRSTGQGCRRKVAVDPATGQPRPRCVMHGGHHLSGKQTPEGRQRIAASMRRYWMRVTAGEVIRPATKKREPAATAEAIRLPPETAEVRRRRIIEDLKVRYPGRDWSES
jgi:hypothetical protein